MIHSIDGNLFLNILTSLKTTSDLKWMLKPLNIEQFTLKSQGKQLSNYQKKKILERSIKLTIGKVVNTRKIFLSFII